MGEPTRRSHLEAIELQFGSLSEIRDIARDQKATTAGERQIDKYTVRPRISGRRGWKELAQDVLL